MTEEELQPKRSSSLKLLQSSWYRALTHPPRSKPPKHMPSFSANTTSSSHSHRPTEAAANPPEKTRQLASPRHDADLSQVVSHRRISNARVFATEIEEQCRGGKGGREAANKRGRLAAGRGMSPAAARRVARARACREQGKHGGSLTRGEFTGFDPA